MRKPSWEKAPGWISSTRFRSIMSCFSEDRPSKDSWVFFLFFFTGIWFSFISCVVSKRSDAVVCASNDLIEDLNVVVGQVQEDQAAQAAESPLLHLADVTALQRQVSQVGRVLESPGGQLLDVVASEIELDCYLSVRRRENVMAQKRGHSVSRVRTM